MIDEYLEGITNRTSRLFPEAEAEAELIRDYNALLKEAQALRLFAGFVESVVSNPVGSYSQPALEGIFGLMRDKIAALPRS
jgi:hypothetical protein